MPSNHPKLILTIIRAVTSVVIALVACQGAALVLAQVRSAGPTTIYARDITVRQEATIMIE